MLSVYVIVQETLPAGTALMGGGVGGANVVGGAIVVAGTCIALCSVLSG